MGQGIKGIIGIKGKIAIVIMIFLMVFSIFYLTKPRDKGITCSLGGNTDSVKLEKSEKDNNYYLSFLRQEDKKTTKIECTKKQYDFIINKEVNYHIFYRLNFFDRKSGKILELDDKPIIYGGVQVALYRK